MNTATAQHTIRRPFEGRMFTGVAAGVSEQFHIDPNIVRVGFAALTLAGPGIPLYLAGMLLIPEEGSDQSIASSIVNSLRK
ncbi:MAG TPA: PspC domain-containing protein [Streptosporangiaceae bacterium]|jgi:phage shock protein PspC (stress-responsive transcriptional regulator)